MLCNFFCMILIFVSHCIIKECILKSNGITHTWNACKYLCLPPWKLDTHVEERTQLHLSITEQFADYACVTFVNLSSASSRFWGCSVLTGRSTLKLYTNSETSNNNEGGGEGITSPATIQTMPNGLIWDVGLGLHICQIICCNLM